MNNPSTNIKSFSSAEVTFPLRGAGYIPPADRGAILPLEPVAADYTAPGLIKFPQNSHLRLPGAELPYLIHKQ